MKPTRIRSLVGFTVFGYSCNMTTAMCAKTLVAAGPPSRDTFPSPPQVSFETRLELSHVAMNVLLDIPEDTREAVQSALKEADALAADDRVATRQRAAQRPELFRSNRVLKAAGDLIRERGWVKGEFEHDRAVCAMGAIRTATRGENWWYQPEPVGEREAITLLLDRIADEFGPGLSVPVWNDQQGSAEGVLRLLW